MVTGSRKFFTLLLLALWLPVTQHCGLEAAGLLATTDECHAQATCPTDHEQPACDVDNCRSIESNAYQAGFAKLKVASPILTPLSCLCCLHDITPETIIVPLISPVRSDVPLELAPTWQFASRAAPAPRAPGYLA